MDACVGVVTAAVVERLGGHGKVCSMYADKPLSTDSVKLLNLTQQQSAVLCTAPLHALQGAKVGRRGDGS
jgi:tRNA (adenine-N(1)-)-methyltransferase non-catalytic subunit